MKIIENTPFSVFSLRLRGDALEGALLCIPTIKAPSCLLLGIHQLFTHFENHTLRTYRQFVRIASGPDKGKMMYTPLKNGKERTITLTITALNGLREAKRKQNEMHLRAGSSWHNEYNMIFTRSNGMFVRFKTLYVHFKAIVKQMGRQKSASMMCVILTPHFPCKAMLTPRRFPKHWVTQPSLSR